MPLFSQDMHKVVTAREWWEADIEDFESLLKHCGRGESGSYEHFNMTMAIHHIKKASQYAQDLLKHFDTSKAHLSTADEPTVKERAKFPPTSGTVSRPNGYTSESWAQKKDREEAAEAEKQAKAVLEVVGVVLNDAKNKMWKMDAEDQIDGALGRLTAMIQSKLDPKVRTNTIIEVLEEKLAQGRASRDR